MDIDTLESMLVGRVLASHSHEMKNVLAIVGETAGLVEDVLEMTRDNGVELPEQLSASLDKALGAIKAQVRRGHRLCTDCNTLAHMPDGRAVGERPLTDIGRVAALAARLMERRARQAKVELKVEEAEAATRPADPLRCLALCLAVLEWAVAATPEDSTMILSAVADEPVFELAPVPSMHNAPRYIFDLAAEAGVTLDPDTRRLRVVLKGRER